MGKPTGCNAKIETINRKIIHFVDSYFRCTADALFIANNLSGNYKKSIKNLYSLYKTCLSALCFVYFWSESQSKNSLNAGIWFATVMFQSGRKFSIDFLLASLEICFESKMADYIIPNWHSYGVLLPVNILFF